MGIIFFRRHIKSTARTAQYIYLNFKGYILETKYISEHTSHVCAFIEILYYMTDFKMIARVEYRGCVFSIKSQLGTKQKGAFIEGVHLWRVHLWRVDCMFEGG